MRRHSKTARTVITASLVVLWTMHPVLAAGPAQKGDWPAQTAAQKGPAQKGGMEMTELSDPPAEKPADEPAEKPADEPAEKPAEQPAEKPAEQPAEKPAEQPAEKPAEQPANNPTPPSEATPAPAEATPAPASPATPASPAAPAEPAAPASPAATAAQAPNFEDLYQGLPNEEADEQAENADGQPVGLQTPGMRTWVDNTGRFEIQARLFEIQDGKVRLIKDTGRTTTVPLRRLSEDDQRYVSKMKKQHGQGAIASLATR